MFSRILVALDGSAHADRALREAVELAKAGRGSLTLITAVPEPSAWILGGMYAVPLNLDELREQITRLRTLHPAIVLYDAHSICSHVPRLFEGELPQFNIGSFDGASCHAALTDGIATACAGDSHVVNGRFNGGWITRCKWNSRSGGIPMKWAHGPRAGTRFVRLRCKPGFASF